MISSHSGDEVQHVQSRTVRTPVKFLFAHYMYGCACLSAQNILYVSFLWSCASLFRTAVTLIQNLFTFSCSHNSHPASGNQWERCANNCHLEAESLPHSGSIMCLFAIRTSSTIFICRQAYLSYVRCTQYCFEFTAHLRLSHVC